MSSLKQVTKPNDIKEYKEWLKAEHNVEIDNKTEEYYNSVTLKIKESLETSSTWENIISKVKIAEDEYHIDTGYVLLLYTEPPKILVKPFESFLLKTFRKNILSNKNWPKAPRGGWVLPSNWFTKINDIIRTMFVVKYLDGVEFLVNKIKSSIEAGGNNCDSILEARNDGYYAAHLYFKNKFEVPKIDWDTERIEVKIEIQITTQLQEVIRRLLHKYYDQKKLGKEAKYKPWQWNYTSEEFVANYTGHILHCVEGMIMDIRKKQSGD